MVKPIDVALCIAAALIAPACIGFVLKGHTGLVEDILGLTLTKAENDSAVLKHCFYIDFGKNLFLLALPMWAALQPSVATKKAIAVLMALQIACAMFAGHGLASPEKMSEPHMTRVRRTRFALECESARALTRLGAAVACCTAGVRKSGYRRHLRRPGRCAARRRGTGRGHAVRKEEEVTAAPGRGRQRSEGDGGVGRVCREEGHARNKRRHGEWKLPTVACRHSIV